VLELSNLVAAAAKTCQVIALHPQVVGVKANRPSQPRGGLERCREHGEPKRLDGAQKLLQEPATWKISPWYCCTAGTPCACWIICRRPSGGDAMSCCSHDVANGLAVI
jgi:hypothetical protein